MGDLYIGLDIGGTKILGALFSESGEMVKIEKKATKASKGAEKTLTRLKKVIELLMEGEEGELKGIGLGVPGLIKNGEILFTPNMPWSNFNLKEELKKIYSVPVFVGNDANVSLLGEWMHGVAKNREHVVGYFIGTGIGGALILNGKLYEGSMGGAGEIGHMTVNPDGIFCGCGAKGCLESYSSKTGILKEIKNQVSRGRETYLSTFLEDSGYILKSSHLKSAYENNDALVMEIFDDMCKYLGVSVSSMINLINPEMVVLGGGIMEALGETLLPEIKKYVDRYVLKDSALNCSIVLSELKDNACLWGAYGMLEENLINPSRE